MVGVWAECTSISAVVPCVVEVATDKEEGHALIGALRKAASHAALQSLAEKVS